MNRFFVHANTTHKGETGVNEPIAGTADPKLVIERYKDTVFKVAYPYCKNRSDAEDVFQEVFLRYLKKMPRFSDENHAKAWFIRVAINCSKKALLSGWFRKTVSLDENLSFETAEESGLFYAVMELPLKYRAVIHLYYYEGYKIRQIAEITSQSETAVSTQLQRAREMLKKRLREDLIYE
jgi:RNA polymerase sigma-70 factor (ECF subfamily)